MHELYAHHKWFFLVFLFCAALVVVNLFHFVLFRFVRKDKVAGAETGWGIQKHLGKPARAVFILTCVLLFLPFVPGIPKWVEADAQHAAVMLMVLALGWFTVGCVYVAQAYLLRKYDLKASDNYHARRVYTQFQVFRRIAITFVCILTLVGLLWTFNDPRIWHYGSGLLASAGLASLVLAAAAKSTASNLLAGLQIALTEPIRLDDVVVVAGEWARVEEITSTYVVLRIWDLRRLIVPLNWFIENPFANWTRCSAKILTTSFLYLDYIVPVPELRAHFAEVLKATKEWDKDVMALQVTNLTNNSMEIRCLMSAPDSGSAFNLQCIVREQMMEWVREHYPTAFPTMRMKAEAEVKGDPLMAAPQGPMPAPVTAPSSQS